MAQILRMPEVSANATHAVLQSWTKREGDRVAAGDSIAEIETDKALVEVNVGEDGVLARILVKAGQEIEVGAPIAVVTAASETGMDIDAFLSGSTTSDKNHAATSAKNSPSNGESALVPMGAGDANREFTPAQRGRLFASPLAKRIANDRGVDLHSLKGSGPNGRIVKRDVEQASAARPSLPVPPAVPVTRQQGGASAADYEEIPHSGMRRAIARRFTESKATIPHFYLRAACRVDKLIALRKEVNEAAPGKISLNDFIVKAVASSLKQVPEMNVTWTDAALRRYARADVAVAVSTPTGLLTPVVRAADSKSLSAMSAEIVELAARARAGRLRQEELEGGSFSVSNLGMFGTQEFTAIINPPQSAILAVGAAASQAVVLDGKIDVATVLRCTLSVDHRAIDGALAARWLKVFVQLIENPLSMLI